MSEEVREEAETEAEEDHTPSEAEETELDFTPANRLAEVGRRASSYEREYRLKLIHRLLLRSIPLDQIAGQLGVSVRTVQREREELFRRLRQEAKDFELHGYIGDTMAFYQEVQAMALRAASTSKTPMNIKLAAMRTAMGARERGARFLGDAGVLDVLKFQPNKNEGSSDLEKIADMTKALLEQDAQGMDLEMPEGVLEDDEEEIQLL